MRPGFILAVVVQEELGLVKNLQKVLVVHGGVKTGRVLLNNAQDASRLEGILSHLEESIHEVFFSKNALRIVVKTLELVGERRSQILRRGEDLLQSIQGFTVLEKSFIFWHLGNCILTHAHDPVIYV